MARYLVVAHQTATDPLLIRRARELAAADPRAEFTILIPEMHVEHRLLCDEVETRAAARQRADEALRAFQAEGLHVSRTEVGDASPLRAIRDEMRRHGGSHDAIVVSTLPPGISRWLRNDVPTRIAHEYSTPVLHVFEGGEAAWEATESRRRDIARGRAGRALAPVAETPHVPASPLRGAIPIAGLALVHLALMAGLAIRVNAAFLRSELLLIGIIAAVSLTAWYATSRPPARSE